MKSTPIIINCFNRFDPLKMEIEALVKRGYTNITLIDNTSTYPPLLEWYKTCGFKVIYMPKNYGSKVLGAVAELRPIIKSDWYVYSDNDVVPTDECPEDFIDNMIEVGKQSTAVKIGLSLKLDDLPGHYRHKQRVINWESQFKRGEVMNTRHGICRKAAIDTTFAVCRPEFHGGWTKNSYRMDHPYEARHMPWYYDMDNLPEDEQYLRNNHNGFTGMWSRSK